MKKDGPFGFFMGYDEGVPVVAIYHLDGNRLVDDEEIKNIYIKIKDRFGVNYGNR